MIGDPQTGVVCGEFSGVPAFDRLKFVFTDSGTGIVEPKLVGLDELGAFTADQIRGTFEETWDDHCGPYRPGLALPTFG